MGVALLVYYWCTQTFKSEKNQSEYPIRPDTTSFLLTEVAIVQLACDQHVSQCDPLSLSLASLETASGRIWSCRTLAGLWELLYGGHCCPPWRGYTCGFVIARCLSLYSPSQSDSYLLSLQTVKDFFLLGRGELYLAFVDLAQAFMTLPPAATTEHGTAV